MKDNTEEVIIRLIRILMKRRLLPKEDADYILESFGVKIKPADWRTGMAFFDKNGKRIEE